MSTTQLSVVKAVVVERSQEEAFRVFTEEYGQWWPLRSHSIHQVDAVSAVLEGRAGGRIYETAADGSQADWGRVLEWDPPRRLRVSWRPSLEPGPATTWEVRFSPIDAGSTRLELSHTGWEALGAAAEEMRERYDSGWDPVLSAFLGAAG